MSDLDLPPNMLRPLPSALSKMPRPTPPHRAYELKVTVSGDTWEDVVQQLRFIAGHVEDHGPKCNSVSGGYGSGHIVEVRVDETMTHDRWAVEIEQYIEKLDAWEKASKGAAGA